MPVADVRPSQLDQETSSLIGCILGIVADGYIGWEWERTTDGVVMALDVNDSWGRYGTGVDICGWDITLDAWHDDDTTTATFGHWNIELYDYAKDSFAR
ncbi:hypothetical protein PSPO01_05708 [Paraphaeosphaeria sporulosa]